MGSCVYKVTGKKVKLSDGRYANLAVSAYKPYRPGYGLSMDEADSKNTKAYYATGCYYADKAAEQGKRTGLVVVGTQRGDTVYKYNGGTFYEYGLLNNESRIVKGVTVEGRVPEFKWFEVKWEDLAVDAAGIEKMLARNPMEACEEVLKYLSRTNPVDKVKISASLSSN